MNGIQTSYSRLPFEKGGRGDLVSESIIPITKKGQENSEMNQPKQKKNFGDFYVHEKKHGIVRSQ